MDWRGKKVLVTGGAGPIGSHLVDALVKRRASVKVVDDLSTGKRDNLKTLLSTGMVPIVQADLRDPMVAHEATAGRDFVFHLAAAHGGRGYVDSHPGECATNFGLDGTVFRSCRENKVGKVVFASSGCIYPLNMQTDPNKITKLKESMAGPPFSPDGTYGMAKLAAEETLRAFFKEWGMKSVSLRYFTVYGPRCGLSHAVMAILARYYTQQPKIEAWGNGSQVRNWTYISDIVEGTILAAEMVDNGKAINLGTTESITVKQCMEYASQIFEHDAPHAFKPDMPVGPLARVCDNALAKELLGWEPQVPFKEGVRLTAEWMANHLDKEETRKLLSGDLTAR
jgi:nucleoside-diphosphate-sugar epimerase